MIKLFQVFLKTSRKLLKSKIISGISQASHKLLKSESIMAQIFSRRKYMRKDFFDMKVIHF